MTLQMSLPTITRANSGQGIWRDRHEIKSSPFHCLRKRGLNLTWCTKCSQNNAKWSIWFHKVMLQWIDHHLCANWRSSMFMWCSEKDADKICTRAEIEVCNGAILTQWVEGEEEDGAWIFEGEKALWATSTPQDLPGAKISVVICRGWEGDEFLGLRYWISKRERTDLY